MEENNKEFLEQELDLIISNSKNYIEMVNMINKRISNQGVDFSFIHSKILMNTNLSGHNKAIKLFKETIPDFDIAMFGEEQEIYIDAINNISNSDIEKNTKTQKNLNTLYLNALSSESVMSYNTIKSITNYSKYLDKDTKEELILNLISMKNSGILDETKNDFVDKNIVDLVRSQSDDYSNEEIANLTNAVVNNEPNESPMYEELLIMAKSKYRNKNYVTSFEYGENGYLSEKDYNNESSHIIELDFDSESDRISSLIENGFIERKFKDALKDKAKLFGDRKGYSYFEPLLGTTIFSTIDIGNNKLIPQTPVLNIKSNPFTGTKISFTPSSYKNEKVHNHMAKEAKSRGIKKPLINLPKNVAEENKYVFLKMSAEALLKEGYQPEDINLGSGISSNPKDFKEYLETIKKDFIEKSTFEFGGLSDDAETKPDTQKEEINKQNQPNEEENKHEAVTPEELQSLSYYPEADNSKVEFEKEVNESKDNTKIKKKTGKHGLH